VVNGMLKHGDLDGFCSAGNTGAMLVGASYTGKHDSRCFKTGSCHSLPAWDNRDSVILDVGLNPDVNLMFLQYGILGSYILQNMFSEKDNPTVRITEYR